MLGEQGGDVGGNKDADGAVAADEAAPPEVLESWAAANRRVCVWLLSSLALFLALFISLLSVLFLALFPAPFLAPFFALPPRGVWL